MCQRANEPKSLDFEGTRMSLGCLVACCAVSFANVVSYLLACILMEFFNHAN